MSNIREGSTPVVKEIASGGCFGDKSLIEDKKRAYTVVCKSDVELITIMKEDFEKIIKGPQLQQEERHLDYLTDLPLFKYFPIERLRRNNDSFHHKYIRKGKEIFSSQNENEYLVVIESGYCQIIVDIKRQKQRPQTCTEQRTKEDLSKEFPSMFKKYTKRFQRRPESADALHWKTGEVRDLMKANILTGVTNPDRMMRIYDPKAELALKWLREKRGLSAIQDRLEQIRKQRLKIHTAMKAKQDEKFTVMFSDRFSAVNRKDEIKKDKDEIKKGIGRTLHRVSYVARTLPATVQSEPATPTKRMSSIAEIIEANKTRHVTPPEQTIPVHIATLGPGSVFGLESLFQKYPIDVRLVSDGTECIFISKKVFLHECNTKVLQEISEQVISYPSPDYIKDKLNEKKEWDSYKRKVMKDLVNRRQTKSAFR